MATLVRPLSTKRRKPLSPVKTLGAAVAKTHFLSLIDEVEHDGSPVTITKRGRAAVRIVPIEQEVQDIFGCMKGTAKAVGDIVEPEPDVWEAMS